MKRHHPVVALAIAVLVPLAGCSDNGGSAAFDPEQTQEDLAALHAVFASPAFQSLSVMGQYFSFPAGPAASASAELVATMRNLPQAPRSHRLVALTRLMARGLAAPEAAMAEVIPAEYRGLTLVWEVDGYVVDSERPGPTNGIRFILYAVNPITGEPSTPLTELGYVDLLDESTTNTAALRLKVVASSVTYVDYVVSATGTPTAPIFNAAGYITDGETQVDFDLTHSASFTIAGYTLGVDYLIDVDSRDFHVDAEVTFQGNDDSESVSLDISLAHGSTTVTIAGTVTDGEGSVEVRANGDLFATITVNGDSLTFTGAGGDALTPAEQQALEALADFVGELFDSAEGILEPVGFLYGV
jgi:hypothetical protein